MFKRISIALLATILFFKSSIFVFATPLPLFYLYVVYGRKTGLITAGSLCLLAVSAFAYGLSGASELAYIGYFLSIGLLLGEGVVRRWGLIRLGFMGVFIPWLAAMAGIVFLQFVVGMQIISSMRSYVLLVIEEVVKLQEGASALSAPQLVYMKGHASDIATFVIRTIPASAWLFSVLSASVVILFGRALTKRRRTLDYLGRISSVRFPFWPVWVTVASGALYFINVYLVNNVYLKYIAVNAVIWCVSIYFIQGCQIIAFWLDKKRSPLLKLVVYGVIVLFLQTVGFIVIALGLSDQWLDFRRRGLATGN